MSLIVDFPSDIFLKTSSWWTLEMISLIDAAFLTHNSRYIFINQFKCVKRLLCVSKVECQPIDYAQWVKHGLLKLSNKMEQHAQLKKCLYNHMDSVLSSEPHLFASQGKDREVLKHSLYNDLNHMYKINCKRKFSKTDTDALITSMNKLMHYSSETRRIALAVTVGKQFLTERMFTAIVSAWFVWYVWFNSFAVKNKAHYSEGQTSNLPVPVHKKRVHFAVQVPERKSRPKVTVGMWVVVDDEELGTGDFEWLGKVVQATESIMKGRYRLVVKRFNMGSGEEVKTHWPGNHIRFADEIEIESRAGVSTVSYELNGGRLSQQLSDRLSVECY